MLTKYKRAAQPRVRTVHDYVPFILDSLFLFTAIPFALDYILIVCSFILHLTT